MKTVNEHRKCLREQISLILRNCANTVYYTHGDTNFATFSKMSGNKILSDIFKRKWHALFTFYKEWGQRFLYLYHTYICLIGVAPLCTLV